MVNLKPIVPAELEFPDENIEDVLARLAVQVEEKSQVGDVRSRLAGCVSSAPKTATAAKSRAA